jgi:hypothetical protein
MIRQLTLEEWFLNYQLTYIDKNYNHLNAFIDVDISKILEFFDDSEKKIPMTSILIKACGMWQEKVPSINKQVFKTLFGQRIYQCDGNSVNVPVLLNAKTGPYVSVTCIENTNKKNLSEINMDLKKYLKKDPSSLPIGRLLIGKKNNCFNRSRLKLIHFIVNNFPRIQEKMKVGTISVSSLLNLDHKNTESTFIAKGPGAISLCVCGFNKETKLMRLGIAWDHATGHGYEGIGAAQELCRILQGENEAIFKELVS